ncbi:MAG: vWA domain-containing protein, partial [Planctomycetaceae bacterium]
MSSNVLSPEARRNVPQAGSAALAPAAGASTVLRGREIPAWLVSLGVHLALLLLFASMTRVTFVDRPQMITSSRIEEIRELDTFKFDATVMDAVGNDSTVNTLSPSVAAATQIGPKPQEQFERQLESELLTVDVPQTNPIEIPHQANLVEQFDATGTTEHTGGVEGAIDRLTFEIAGSLKERKTLVIWLFDESLSLMHQRAAIADRFENVYKQLGHLKATEDKALKTAVASFGRQTHLMTDEPVDDVTELVTAVREIKNDESGKENVFTAVDLVLGKFKSHRTKMRRNMMIIIVTDERGDDYEKLETVIREAKRLGVKVYCVGNAAVFGREKGYVSFTDSDGYKWNDLEVDAGPETVAPERLRLAFWGTNARDLDQISAGYGPYALTRLCAETGG